MKLWKSIAYSALVFGAATVGAAPAPWAIWVSLPCSFALFVIVAHQIGELHK